LQFLFRSLQAGNYCALRNKVVITFDDGYRDFVVNALPILLEHQATATMFLVTGMLGGESSWQRSAKPMPLMSEDEIRHIKSSGISLGSHTVTHAKLTDLGQDDLQRQLRESYDALTAFGESFYSLSYPWGQWSSKVVDAVNASGYECALTAEEQTGLSAANVNIYLLPRIFMGRDMDLKRFQSLLMRTHLETEPRKLYRNLRGTMVSAQIRPSNGELTGAGIMLNDGDNVDLTQGISATMTRNVHVSAGTTPASNAKQVKISFVMIVLNGMPFIEYALKAIYDEAHEIIIVEGAVRECFFAANPDGSSTDGTVECIRSFPDPYRKIRLIQGGWPEKCEMQNIALAHVTGDYVWLVDSDEIYRKEDLSKVRDLIGNNPHITQINVIGDNFWKGFDFIFESPKFFEAPAHWRRIFKYVAGARFTTHRPPTMVYPGHELSTEQMYLIDGTQSRAMGIVPFHYSYVLESQVKQKVELYNRYGWGKMWNLDLVDWYNNFYLKWTPENRNELERLYPIWTGDPHSYSMPFTGTHPEVMEEFITAYRGREFSLQVGSDGPASCAVDEKEALATVGSVKYQRKTLDAWSHIELDSPLLFRKESMEQHIENGSPFWNIHVALAFVGSRFQPRSYLEVGVRTGASMVQVLYNSSPVQVTGVDLWSGNYASLPNALDFAKMQIARFQQGVGQQSPIELVQGNSHVILKQLIMQMRKYELITVDGDHSDAGAMSDLEDAYLLLEERGIIVFDDIIHPSFPTLLSVIQEFARRHPDLQLIFNTTQDNGTALLLRGITWNTLKGYRIAGEGVIGSDLTQIQEGSGFEASLRELVLSTKPRTIIETGTYLGNGTTRIVATALRDAGLIGTTFYSIECNPVHHRQAYLNLDQAGLLPFVKPLLGLSVPRNLLPSVENILDDTVRNVVEDGIFADHQEQDRAALYYRETDFPDIPEDLIGACLEHSGRRPDLVLLDSAGHMGSVEFEYVIERLQGECYLVLDDICHVKHYRSFRLLQKDPRFTVLTSSDEKFGFCIARFNPGARVEPTVERRWILWLRPDSIGDNILAMAMLPYLKARRPDAAIAVFCQEHIAELYEACPAVDRVITFNRMHALEDEAYRATILRQLQELRADICLNSVYSRDFVADFFAAQSGAQERIALMGDLANTSTAEREAYNRFYTSILTSAGEHKTEIERHQDFLRGIGITGERLKPSMWMFPDDSAFSDRFFKEHGFKPEKTIALFAGAQHDVRFYNKYGEGLAAFCGEMGFSVVALGSAADYGINQQNLDAAGVMTANLSGATTLRQSAAILSRCRLAVGAETGLAHMACAVGTPNIIVLGGGHFGRFMPYSPLTSVVCLPLECYGCNWHCRYERVHCVRDISPAVIQEALRHSLAGRSDHIRYFVQGDSLRKLEDGGPTRDLSTRFMLVEGELIVVENT
jgi:ADP-heptose:LPS heptosyltransferase/peptidoglycan/xylan/chitin deacetylase (PgdA/CDA1 family)/predicted O-methyltransferase YrrM